MSGNRKANWRERSRELHGIEKRRAIREFIEWLYRERENGRADDGEQSSPIAEWTAARRRRLARERAERQGYYRNSKPDSAGKK